MPLGDYVISLQPWCPGLAWWSSVYGLLVSRVQMGTHMPQLNNDILARTQPTPTLRPTFFSPSLLPISLCHPQELVVEGTVSHPWPRLWGRKVKGFIMPSPKLLAGWARAPVPVGPRVPASQGKGRSPVGGMWLNGRSRERAVLSGPVAPSLHLPSTQGPAETANSQK